MSSGPGHLIDPLRITLFDCTPVTVSFGRTGVARLWDSDPLLSLGFAAMARATYP